MSIRVFLVQAAEVDRSKFRKATASSQYDIMAHADCGDVAIELLQKDWYEIVVVGLETPRTTGGDPDGLAVIRDILALDVPPKVVATYGVESRGGLSEAIAAGVAATLDNNFFRGEVLEELQRAMTFRAGQASARRKRVRVETNLLAWYKKKGDGLFTKLKPAMIDDITEDGLGVKAQEGLPKGTELKLRFKLPSARKPIRVRGRVAWCSGYPKSGYYPVGLEFSDLSDSDRERIRLHIQHLLARGK